MKLHTLAFISGLLGFSVGFVSERSPLATLQQGIAMAGRMRPLQAVESTAESTQIAFISLVDRMKGGIQGLTWFDKDPWISDSQGFEAEGSDVQRIVVANHPAPSETNINESTDHPPESSEIPFGVWQEGQVLNVLADLAYEHGFEIYGAYHVNNPLISFKLEDRPVEESVRQLMRIANIKNYALSYVTNAYGGHNVATITFLPQKEEKQESYDQLATEKDGQIFASAEAPPEEWADLEKDIISDFRSEFEGQISPEDLAQIEAWFKDG